MHIGIYGGTFDPVHLGHLVLAEQCREQLSLDEVWFVPAAVSPHKTGTSPSAAHHRRAMLEYALAGHERFRLDDCELKRPGPSFTVDTLEHLHQQHPEHEWTLLIGADTLREFSLWRQPQRILELARLGVVNRGGQSAPAIGRFEHALGDAARGRLSLVTMPGLDIAARDLRQRVREGKSIRFLVPRAVEVYIKQNGLYLAE